MARPLRINYPGAWYHTMNRGLRKENIYKVRNDYLSFLKLLKDSSLMFTVNIAGYCLMNNHYHLLLQTPSANLSRFMKQIDGVYTQIFNRRHNLDGPLFRGRFKSMVIQDDSHLLEILRYIHHNPMKAGLESKLGEYPWYSYRGYLLDSSEWDWLYKDFLLSMFSGSKSVIRKQYGEFMSKESSKEIKAIFNRGKQVPIFGSNRFKEKIKKLFSNSKLEAEIPESIVLVPDIEKIKMAVCNYYYLSEDDLLISRRGVTNEPRNMAIFLIRRLRGERLFSLAKHFKINKYSTVSSIVTRFQRQLKHDKELRKKHAGILNMLKIKMSQAKT